MGSTLELKGFSMGGQRVVSVRCLSWKLNADQAKKLEGQLEAAVERLAAILPVPAPPKNLAPGKAPFADKP
jgi:hypothetical protein